MSSRRRRQPAPRPPRSRRRPRPGAMRTRPGVHPTGPSRRAAPDRCSTARTATAEGPSPAVDVVGDGGAVVRGSNEPTGGGGATRWEVVGWTAVVAVSRPVVVGRTTSWSPSLARSWSAGATVVGESGSVRSNLDDHRRLGDGTGLARPRHSLADRSAAGSTSSTTSARPVSRGSRRRPRSSSRRPRPHRRVRGAGSRRRGPSSQPSRRPPSRPGTPHRRRPTSTGSDPTIPPGRATRSR